MTITRAVHQAFISLALLAPGFALTLYAQSPDEFNPGANGIPYVLALQPDGKILVGGTFTTLAGRNCYRIGRLDPDGVPDTNFTASANNWVNALAVQPDGKIVVGGDFTLIGGQTRNRIARLSPEGVTELSFNASASGTIWALALQPDGGILVGGLFSYLSGQPRENLARLKPDGTLDATFNPGAGVSGSGVHCLTVQSNGQILVGGTFQTLAGQPRSRLGRLNPDGTLDTGFNPGAGNYVNCFAEQPDGKILVGGYFTTLGGRDQSYIGRLHQDGTPDTNFVGRASGTVDSICLQTDGKILVGGLFWGLTGKPCIAFGRLYPDGQFDTNMNAAFNSGSQVYSVAVQPDGKVLLGGQFTTVGGQARADIARLINTEPATENLASDGATITWLRGGTAPEFVKTAFESSTNDTTWFELGIGQRVPGGWHLAGLNLPGNATIRARGFVQAGLHNDSSWFVERTLQPTLDSTPSIVVHDGNFGFRASQFGFNMVAPDGHRVVVEASTNLLDWIPLSTNTFGADPPYFSDPTSGSPSRFYRLRSQ